MIHITDSLTDRILDDISEELFWNDKHRKSLKDTLETFDFTTFADKPFSEHLAKRNRIIIPDEDGQFVEFIIENTRKFHGVNGFSVEVYTSASYIELIKAKVISPQTTPSWTPRQHVDFALAGTGWEAGEIYFAGVRSLTIEKHTNPFAYLKRLAAELDLELHFRVEKDGNKIVRRYVDLVERVGAWRGREGEFGKDLIGIERKENNANIVTALVGLGPIREDGTRLEVFVEDKDALARWGRNGQHLVEVYEPQSTDQDMTIERLTELTENELKKRVNSVVEYLADIADLEKVPGLEHEKIRFGDTIKIKDTMFNPPLYLEARVHTQERSIKKNGTKKVTLGDYIEYTEEDVLAIWKSLQAEIVKKVSMSDVTEVVYTKPEVDDKDASVYQDSTYYSDNVSETKKQEAIQVAATDATSKANAAENNAKTHADTKSSEAENNAKTHADMVAEQKKQEAIQAAILDAETKVNQAKSDLEAEIATKADADWVNGQLVLKADNSTVQDLQNEVSNKADVTWVNNQLVLKESTITKASNVPLNPTINQLWLDTNVTPNVLKRWSGTSWVKATPTNAGEVNAYTKSEVDNALNTKVSVTQYNTDISGIVTDLQSHESRITQNEQEIVTKVSQTDYDALEGRVSNAESSIVQNANAIQSKVSQTDFDTLEGRVSTTESTITQHANLIEQKVNQTDYDTDMNGVITRLDSAETRITQTETEIATKVSNTTYQQDKTAIEGDISSLETRMSQAETTITQNANSIALKANATDVYTKTEVDNSLANKADTSTVSAIEQRVTQAEAELVVQADQIATKVSQTDFNTYKVDSANDKSFRIGAKTISTAGWYRIATNVGNRAFARFIVKETYSGRHSTAIFNAGIHYGKNPTFTLIGYSNYGTPAVTKARILYKSTYDDPYLELYIVPTAVVEVWCLDNVQTSGWVKVDLTAGSVPSGYSAVEWDINASKVVDVTSENTALDTSNVNGIPASQVTTRLTNAESSITQLSNEIELKVSQSQYDIDIPNLQSRMSSAESTLSVHANQIATKVEQDGVISAINQTAEQIKIQASKIQLQGAVTVLSDITDDLGTINAGIINGIDINGVNISGSTFYAEYTPSTATSYGSTYFDGDELSFWESDITEHGMYNELYFSTKYAANKMRFDQERSGQYAMYAEMDIMGLYFWGLGYPYNGLLKMYREVESNGGGSFIEADSLKVIGVRGMYGVSDPTGNPILNDHLNGNVSINAAGGDLYLGYYSTGTIRMQRPLDVGEYGINWPVHASLSLQNGWVNYGGGFISAAYSKDGCGVVHLRGLIKNGSVGSVIAVLPVGCRPYATEIFTVMCGGNAIARVDVRANGEIVCQAASSTAYLSLSGISFRAEN